MTAVSMDVEVIYDKSHMILLIVTEITPPVSLLSVCLLADHQTVFGRNLGHATCFSTTLS